MMHDVIRYGVRRTTFTSRVVIASGYRVSRLFEYDVTARGVVVGLLGKQYAFLILHFRIISGLNIGS